MSCECLKELYLAPFHLSTVISSISLLAKPNLEAPQPYLYDTTSLVLFVHTAHQTLICPSKLIWHALLSMKTSLILLLKLTTLFSFTPVLWTVLCTHLFGRLHSFFFSIIGWHFYLSPCKLLKQHHWLSSSYKQWKFIPHSICTGRLHVWYRLVS